MNTLFISVPQWYPVSPYLASAVLAGQLRQAGFSAGALDLNIRFFNDILKEKNVLSAAAKAKEQLPGLTAIYSSLYKPEENFASYDDDTKTRLLRLKTIKEYFDNGKHNISETAKKIENAVAVMKDGERFYDPELLFAAKDTINDALAIISLPYAPAKIMLDNFIADPVCGYDYSGIKKMCFDKSRNMFIDYFESIFSSLPLDNTLIAGISVTDLSQIVPALTLGAMIKKRCGCRVALGGNYIYKVKDSIKKNPEFFELFCDFVTIGDGELASVELAEYAEGKRILEEVHSLMYRSGNTVSETAAAPLLKLDTLSFPDFDDINFSDYFSPEPVIPVQLGKGCYWGKCAFCDFYTGQQKFDIKSVNHAADEVEYLYNRYGYTHFVFVDEAVPPRFYDKFIDELIRRDIHIHFYSFARFDAGFTGDLIKKLHSAGAEFFSWGYEAESPRLLKLMNKGIDPAVRKRIIDDCVAAGMWTQCTFLLGYPTETAEELQSTIDIIENRQRINSCTPSNFALKKNAILQNETEEVGITSYKSNGDFHVSCSWQSDNITMAEVKQNRMVFERRFLAETADSLWSLGFTDTDHLLLYLSKYGRDFVRDYRLSFKKTQG